MENKNDNSTASFGILSGDVLSFPDKKLFPKAYRLRATLNAYFLRLIHTFHNQNYWEYNWFSNNKVCKYFAEIWIRQSEFWFLSISIRLLAVSVHRGERWYYAIILPYASKYRFSQSSTTYMSISHEAESSC